MKIECGDWVILPKHGTQGRVVGKTRLWGQEVLSIWVADTETVVRVPAADVSTRWGTLTTHHLAYLAAAARVADALNEDVLLAPMESSVIPLPHQIRALCRAVSHDRVRYLLADEVGLGKTIEAGLIMRELKLRGLVRRTLVIAPKGLVTQWVAEMRLHFNEEFQPILPQDIQTLRRIAGISPPPSDDPHPAADAPAAANPWRLFHQVICPMDSVKPLDSRRGWSKEQASEINRERFEDLISAGWDLVIVDEAHRLGGSTDQVARHKLGQGLAGAAPYLLLLSATPHQGKTEAFHRILSLLDPQAFPDPGSVTKERVQPYVIRTEKRRAIDAEGKSLFKPRRTETATISWQERHREQKFLYEAVTEYVRQGYNRALREKRRAVGFLMILMQRLVVSSTRAIKTTLERRLEVLRTAGSQLGRMELPDDFGIGKDLDVGTEEFYDLDGEEQLQLLLGAHLKGIRDEKAEVQRLLEAAGRCESRGPDAKAEALLDWIYRLQAEEGDPELKVLVFTEFVPTQQMLFEFLTDRGFRVVFLNGSMGMEERKRVQEAFAKDARILLSTDAGGEGLNLQFCHVVINYDIPWNPMKLEQRIGRVDRIGQKHPVRAVNFVFEDSVEHRVREVLEEKLAVIFDEFGIDKTGDVLDSAQAGRIFDELYVEAVLNPGGVATKADEVLQALQEQAREARQSTSLLGAVEDLDAGEAQRLLEHPLPHWVERMTVSYIRAHGGVAERKDEGWYLRWPDGTLTAPVVFTSKEAQRAPSSRRLTLEDPKIRSIAQRLLLFVPGQPIPVVGFGELAMEMKGWWSLWRISLYGEGTNRHRMMPLFVADDGRAFTPTARYLWDHLLTGSPRIIRHLDPKSSAKAFERLRHVAEQHGEDIFQAMRQAHRDRIRQEEEKAVYAYETRRRALERIGLPQVRRHRLRLLEQEKERVLDELQRRMQIIPEMTAVLVMRVESGVHGELA